MNAEPDILSPCLLREIRDIAARDRAGERKDRFLRCHEFAKFLYFNCETAAEEEAAMELYRDLAKV